LEQFWWVQQESQLDINEKNIQIQILIGHGEFVGEREIGSFFDILWQYSVRNDSDFLANPRLFFNSVLFIDKSAREDLGIFVIETY
jgi:hypothetical protein